MNNSNQVNDAFQLSSQEAESLKMKMQEAVSDYMDEARNGFFKSEIKMPNSSNSYLPSLEIE